MRGERGTGFSRSPHLHRLPATPSKDISRTSKVRKPPAAVRHARIELEVNAVVAGGATEHVAQADQRVLDEWRVDRTDVTPAPFRLTRSALPDLDVRGE